VRSLLDRVQIRDQRLAAHARFHVRASFLAALVFHPPFELIVELVTTHRTH
jgi:hypothetical protein